MASIFAALAEIHHIYEWIKDSNKEVVRNIYNIRDTDLDE